MLTTTSAANAQLIINKSTLPTKEELRQIMQECHSHVAAGRPPRNELEALLAEIVAREVH
jgi:hypothetical protein